MSVIIMLTRIFRLSESWPALQKNKKGMKSCNRNKIQFKLQVVFSLEKEEIIKLILNQVQQPGYLFSLL